MERPILTKIMDVSIIIVNYNTCELTIQCIGSIYKKTCDVSFEVIVVDNASIDDSVSTIRKEFPEVLVVESKENLGFGKANNLGVTVASGEYLFFLNSDTVLLNNAVLLLYDFYSNNRVEKIGGLGSILYDDNMNIIHSYGCFPTFGRILKNIINGYLRKDSLAREVSKSRQIDRELVVDYVTGADFFIEKKLFLIIGGFHSLFFMYYEETFLQYQLSLLGYNIYVINTPQIVHLEGKSYVKRYSNQKRIQADKSMLIYLKFRYSIFKMFFFRIVYFLFRIPVLLNLKYSFKENLVYLFSII